MWWRATTSNHIIKAANLQQTYYFTYIDYNFDSRSFFFSFASVSFWFVCMYSNAQQCPMFLPADRNKNKNQFYDTDQLSAESENKPTDSSIFLCCSISHNVSFVRIHRHTRVAIEKHFITDFYLLRRYRFRCDSIPRDGNRNSTVRTHNHSNSSLTVITIQLVCRRIESIALLALCLTWARHRTHKRTHKN